MNALFVANIEMGENEGIYKKVSAEAEAIKKILGRCNLVTKENGKAKIKNGKKVELNERSVLDYVVECLNKNNLDFLYIRHMIPSFKLIVLLKSAKDKDVVVYYEIPTYPYFGEQFKTSKKSIAR